MPDLSIDLNLPTVVPTVCESLGLDLGRRSPIRNHLDHKDASAIAALSGEAAEVLGALLDATGPAERAVKLLEKIKLPKLAAAERKRLGQLVKRLRTAAPEIGLTVDPVENRGFEYHSGLSFTFFALDVRGSLGRGGRYSAGEGEPATGFTLFLDTVLRALPQVSATQRLYLPFETPAKEGVRLRKEGWVTVAALENGGDPEMEARRLACTHLYRSGKVVTVKQT